ncbi:ElaA protein [Bacillus thermophilus]|uniref:ElaA protein n=1 Tax=Siminovitchia thermophila TaxID=1245522 RepID=A0ABS2R3G4_9BACI|nr:GNAT family N-acetyltransferase [Siminovitchia thermophila]MBM7713945.1 ElaA protein [Siminovitchia thermophila]ONK23830.1 GNAT family N-acetyltransferase [Bacillus sp. VT-16-64]
MEWKLKTFDELTVDELYSILQARVDVFVVEQECAYRELDDHDRVAFHLYAVDAGKLAGYARILPPGSAYRELSIGRVLIRKEYRRKGLAKELMKRALRFIQQQTTVDCVKVQAQEYLLSFYGSFGFQPVSEVYMDEGIPHVDMILQLDD